MTAASDRRYYSLAGRILEISAARDQATASFARALNGLEVEPSEPDFQIELTETELLDDAVAGRIVFDGEVPFDGYCRMFEEDGTVHLVFPGSQVLTLDGKARKARLHARAGTPVTWTGWMMALDAALDACDQYMLHMAGLTLPGSADVVLIHAPSGTGKTTTSLALASGGYGLCSDDTMVVGLQDAPVAWGLPRQVKIHRFTAEMLPYVQPVLGSAWDDYGEQPVTLEALRSVLKVESVRPRPVKALLHLARSADGRTRLLDIARTEAMAALAADNVRTGLTGLLPIQKRRMQAIAKLVSHVPTYLLEVGNRPEDAARLVGERLALPVG